MPVPLVRIVAIDAARLKTLSADYKIVIQ
jgi:hypothetical protein